MAHDQEVMGSNPGTVYWMDVSDLLAITLNTNWKIKVAKWAHQNFFFLKRTFLIGIITYPSFCVLIPIDVSHQ